jgi:hypothetical protein
LVGWCEAFILAVGTLRLNSVSFLDQSP